MTFAAFTQTMDRLSGLKFKPSSLQTHWEALSDLSAAELDAAVARAARECEEFPAPRMIRALVDDYRRDQPVPEEEDRSAPWRGVSEIVLPNGVCLPVKREWRYFCEECSDTGMRSFWCGAKSSVRFPWLGLQRCSRRKEHGEHEWVDACPCADTNPDVQRKKQRAMQVTRKQANG